MGLQEGENELQGIPRLVAEPLLDVSEEIVVFADQGKESSYLLIREKNCCPSGMKEAVSSMALSFFEMGPSQSVLNCLVLTSLPISRSLPIGPL
jgi:hypothetical protein